MENLSILTASSCSDVPRPPTSGIIYEELVRYYGKSFGGLRVDEHFINDVTMRIGKDTGLSSADVVREVSLHLSAMHGRLCSFRHETVDNEALLAVPFCIPSLGPNYNVACVHGGGTFLKMAIAIYLQRKLIGLPTAGLLDIQLRRIEQYGNPVLDEFAQREKQRGRDPMRNEGFVAGHQWLIDSRLKIREILQNVGLNPTRRSRFEVFREACHCCLHSRPETALSPRKLR